MISCATCGTENPEGARYCMECAARLDARTDPAAPDLPTSVDGGRYEVKHLLGEGSRKRVYLAVDTRLGREVALALVKTEGLDEVGRQRIAREARATARLGDHPNVVTVHDVGDEGDTPFIVSQRMPGGSLADRLAETDDHRLPIPEALRVTEDVALALAHAHDLGIVHRDVKPANIWLTADGDALLGDFGLAVPLDASRLTSEGMVVGTVAYLAPEQALGRDPDPRSDLYALGACTYEMLCGRPPFLGDDAVSVIGQHLNTSPVVPSWHRADVPPALESLVLRLLAKDPGERSQSAAEVVDALHRIRDSSMEPTPVVASGAPAPPLTRADWGRFVGRSDEMAQLVQALDDACAGRGALALVGGEPGIGKTRIVEELHARAAVRGAQVCWGHSYEGELGVPYLPFVEAFRAYARARSDDDLRAELTGGGPEMATLVSELRERFPDIPEAPPLDAEAERLRLFDGVTTFVRNASLAQPLVIVLDDLHWADKPTLLLLKYLARNIGRDRMLVLGTYRDMELDRTHPLAEAIADLRRENLYRRVLLRGLPPTDIKALVEAVGGQEIPDGFADILYRETEGNPFFVAEIIRNLVETGAIRRDGDHWVGDPEAVLRDLPEGVKEAIGRRLTRLSEPCNRMLSVAAAMPGGFTIDVIAATLDASEDDLLDPLDEALGMQVLRERKERVGTYEFVHALIRQTLYGELSTPRRVRLHRQIASTLEAVAGSADSHLNELAYHWFQAAPAGEAAKAVEYATRAAERASGQAAHDEAARYYDMALQALDFASGADERERGELQLRFGSAQRWAGDYEGASQTLAAAAAVARRVGDPRLLADVAIEWSFFGMPAERAGDDLETLITEALGQDGIDDRQRSRLLSHLASYTAFVATNGAALVTEAIEVARRSGDPSSLARALRSSMFIRRFWPSEEERLDVLGEIDRLAAEAGDEAMRFANAQSVMFYGQLQGRRDRMDRGFETMISLANTLRSPAVDSQLAMSRTCLAISEGRYGDAERHGEEYLEISRRLGDQAAVATYGALMFPMWREQKRIAPMEGATRRIVERAPAVFAWRCGLLMICIEAGRLAEAQEELDVIAADDFSGVADDVLRLYTLALSAETAARLGDAARCEHLHELISAYVAEGFTAVMIGPTAYWGLVSRTLALLDNALGRYDEAWAHLDAAEEREERMAFRPWVARTRYDRACALAARDRPGDAYEAIVILNEVLDEASAVGMPRLTDEALDLKLRLQGIDTTAVTASIDVVAASVTVDRPDLRRHASPDGWVTIAFSDIEGYTSMTERLGDVRAQEVLRAHNEIVREALVRHDGIEVKSQGDGFMLAFGHTVDAVHCADEIRREIAAHDFGPDAGAVRVRVGVHTGEAIKEADDFFGRTVIVAARVADRASGGEVLVTEAVRASLPADAFSFGEAREVELKGLSGKHRVHPV